MTLTAELLASVSGGVTVYDEFCGGGGSLKGISAVRGTMPRFAANHDAHAIATHAANNPGVDHFQGDVQKADITKFPPAAFFWASPACPKWANARGVVRDFDKVNQIQIPGLEAPVDEAAKRSRALMEEVPRYLQAMANRGRPVLAGVVENVIECRKWSDWGRWRREIEGIGPYRTRLIAFNSMHAWGTSNPLAPQSRDRLYLAYWHAGLGKDPAWDKWLRPKAWCPGCEQVVHAMQSFKRPGVDMGRYKSQYVYRCPASSCRNRVVEPYVLPASAVIDWSDQGALIGERAKLPKPKTMARIGAGILKFGKPITLEAAGHTFERRAGVRTWPVDQPITTQSTTATKALAVPPMLVPAGGTWRNDATLMADPMATRTTRETDAVIALPAMLVPVEGRPDKEARPVHEPARTQTTRAETAVAFPPFIATLRGGGCLRSPHGVDEAVTAVSASGNHHGLALPPDVALLAPYYGNSGAYPTTEPMGTVTTVERNGLARTPMALDPEAVASAVAKIERIEAAILAIPEKRRADERGPFDAAAELVAAGMGLEAVRFRMLGVAEIQAAMGLGLDYVLLPASKRDNIRLLGNAVTPPVAELITSALMEVIAGEQLERSS